MNVGLYFGSFNPIHIGHLIIANHLVQFSKLDELWFVVSPLNPHKKKSSLLEDYHRLALVKEAIEDNLKLKASDIEFNLPQPSYTIDTLTYLKEKYPKRTFALIMGEDNLRSLHKWKNYKQITGNHKIYVYPRMKTVQEQKAGMEVDQSSELKNTSIEMVDAPVMEISSSMIRNMIRAGKDVRYLLSEPVFKYADEMNFYK